jgi:hypothetical protein
MATANESRNRSARSVTILESGLMGLAISFCIGAVYWRTQNISETARVCKVARSTVSKVLA